MKAIVVSKKSLPYIVTLLALIIGGSIKGLFGILFFVIFFPFTVKYIKNMQENPEISSELDPKSAKRLKISIATFAIFFIVCMVVFIYFGDQLQSLLEGIFHY